MRQVSVYKIEAMYINFAASIDSQPFEIYPHTDDQIKTFERFYRFPYPDDGTVPKQQQQDSAQSTAAGVHPDKWSEVLSSDTDEE